MYDVPELFPGEQYSLRDFPCKCLFRRRKSAVTKQERRIVLLLHDCSHRNVKKKLWYLSSILWWIALIAFLLVSSHCLHVSLRMLIEMFTSTRVSILSFLASKFLTLIFKPRISLQGSTTSDNPDVRDVVQVRNIVVPARFWVDQTHVCTCNHNVPEHHVRVPGWFRTVFRPVSYGILAHRNHAK